MTWQEVYQEVFRAPFVIVVAAVIILAKISELKTALNEIRNELKKQQEHKEAWDKFWWNHSEEYQRFEEARKYAKRSRGQTYEDYGEYDEDREYIMDLVKIGHYSDPMG